MTDHEMHTPPDEGPPGRGAAGRIRAMRTEEQLRHAHDTLHGVVTGEADLGLDHHTRGLLALQLDVLCWALGCPNPGFGERLDVVRRLLRARGYVGVSAGAVLTPEEFAAWEASGMPDATEVDP